MWRNCGAVVTSGWGGGNGEIPGQRFVDLYVYVTTVSIWVSRVVLLVKNLPANEVHITDVGFDLWVRKIP